MFEMIYGYDNFKKWGTEDGKFLMKISLRRPPCHRTGKRSYRKFKKPQESKAEQR